MLQNSMCWMCLGAPGCLRWNSAVSSRAETSEADSQELCLRPYPFYLMRYWNLLRCQRLSSISSTSHSGSLSMTMGGGWSSVFRPVIGSSRAGVSFTTLNTGQSCFIRCGSLKQQAMGPIRLSTTKGPSRRCESFYEGHIVWMSDASRKTLSPGLNTGAGVLRRSQYFFMSSCALRIADFASSIAVLILSMNSLTVSRPEGFCQGSKPI